MDAPDPVVRLNAALEGRYRIEREWPRLSWTVLSVALLLLAAPAAASCQQLINSGDLADLEWPSPDARIQYGESPLQFGHLRLPEGSGPHPVVVFIHGGCWLSMFDIRHAGQAEQAIADAGYAVWSLEYRRVGDPGGGWPGTFLDVARGVDHLSELADEYPLDLDRVIASGHSAGGHLALWASARPGIPASSELYTAQPLPIHGVLALAPAPNLESLHNAGVCGDVVDSLMGGSPDAFPNRYDIGSPMRLMPADVPQRLIVGGQDRSWSPSGRAYFELARAEGKSPVSLREASESGHFEMIVPSTSSWPVVLEELEKLARDMARARDDGR
jgi:acetyl esterase/lipase